MKHPYQITVTDKSGDHLFVSVKNHLYAFNLKTGAVVGSWVDTVDISVPLKKQQEDKIKVLEQEALRKDPNEDDESASKKLKNANGIKIPKIPVPGPGAPPIYNYVRSLTLSNNGRYLIGTTDSDKAAVIFNVDFSEENCLKLVKRQIFPKRPCAVSTSADDSTLIVADKFGDVYSIPIDTSEPVDEKSLVPILGHVSMLSDVLVAQHNNKQFILTGDRDEHIRITNYPRTYVVKNWLFGHREFVSNLHIPSFDPSILISGGGDDYLAIWKWHENKLLSKVQLRDLIQPFLNDSHLPPERFLKDDSPKEISIVKILTYANPKSNEKLLVVLCENTNCILTFKLDENEFSATHKQTFETKYPLIDITLYQDTILATLDIESEDNLIELYNFDVDSVLNDSSKENLSLINSISLANNCDVESRKDFYPLYYINSLRKRSEH